jgi:hypothetical protein
MLGFVVIPFPFVLAEDYDLVKIFTDYTIVELNKLMVT